MDGLTPGRMVHYTAGAHEMNGEYDGVHMAAIVTSVYDAGEESINGHVDLHVFGPYGVGSFERARIEPGAPGNRGTWHWIERA